MFRALKSRFARKYMTPHAGGSEGVPVTTILHIDSGILGGYSASRGLTADIVARAVGLHPGARVIYRDLVVDAALHLSDAHLAVFQGGEVTSLVLGRAVALGGAYIDELFAADIIVIGTRMYNFSVPSRLKGRIDSACGAGRTFQYGPDGPEGLLPKGKKVIIASTQGSVYTGNSQAAALEHHESYLRGVLGFIGLTDVTTIRAEGLNLGEEPKAAAITRAKAQIASLAA
jgi:FMN-dependent NADH-azoreductase